VIYLLFIVCFQAEPLMIAIDNNGVDKWTSFLMGTIQISCAIKMLGPPSMEGLQT
jgi:hypothetical protein